MLILLSSCMRKRYRDDILRCLAAPIGAQIQFRYSESIVDKLIWQTPDKYEGKEGIVCNIDLASNKTPYPLIPVRSVIVKKIQKHGTTMSIVLEIRDLALAEDIEKFTLEVDTKSGNQTPKNKDNRDDAVSLSGDFFFNTSDKIDSLQIESSITSWESITNALFEQTGYAEEQFFWTVLGLHEDSSKSILDTDKFREWDENVDFDKDYSLLVYVYHPDRDRWKPKLSQLCLTSSFSLSTSYPLDVTIDSPYDLKRWRFQIQSSETQLSNRGWMRIGAAIETISDPQMIAKTKTAENHTKVSQLKLQSYWEIDLPLNLRFSRVRFVMTTVLLGLLISVPAAISIIIQDAASCGEKAGAIAGSWFAGIVAATLARVVIRKRKVI